MDGAAVDANDTAAPPAVGEISDSRLFYGIYTAVLAALGIATIPMGYGLLGGLFFGGYAAWTLWRLIDKRPRLFITDEGIVDRTYLWSPGLIRWDEILDFRPARWGLISVRLRDEQAFWDRLPLFAKFAAGKAQLHGLGPAFIVGWALEASRSELLDALESGADAHALRAVKAAAALTEGHARD